MPSWQIRVFPICLAAIASASGAADDARPVYPVTALLHVPDELRRTCLVQPNGALTFAAGANCDTPVGQQLAEAFASRVPRLFGPPAAGTPPDLILEPSLADASLREAAGVRKASVAAWISVREPGADEVARVRVEGSADAMGDATTSDAFSRAARDAAEHLQMVLASSDSLVRWIVDHRIEPAVSDDPAPRRGDLVVFLDAGGGAARGSEGTGSALVGRGGVAGRWFIAQASLGTWSVPWGPAGGISAQSFGLELGPVLRLGRSWELRATAGLHFASGSLDISSSPQYVNPRQSTVDFSRKLPSVAAVVQYAFWPGWKNASRIRVGLEARKYFGDDAVVDEVKQVVPVAGTSIGFFLGFEFPGIPARVPHVSPK